MQYFPQFILKFIGKSTEIFFFNSNILKKFLITNFHENFQKLNRKFPDISSK